MLLVLGRACCVAIANDAVAGAGADEVRVGEITYACALVIVLFYCAADTVVAFMSSTGVGIPAGVAGTIDGIAASIRHDRQVAVVLGSAC